VALLQAVSRFWASQLNDSLAVPVVQSPLLTFFVRLPSAS